MINFKFENNGVLKGAIVTAIVGVLAYYVFQFPVEEKREEQRFTQEFVLLFSSDPHATYRDKLTRTWMLPEIAAKRGSSDKAYAKALLAAADRDPEIRIAVFAMVDFLLNVQSCILSEICANGQAAEPFRTYTDGFYDNFVPILRQFDCQNEGQSLEKKILFFAPQKKPKDDDCSIYE